MLKRLSLISVIFLAIILIIYGLLYRADIPYDVLEKKYASDDSRFITLPGNDLRLHYRDEGKIDGPVLLMVHGYSASLHTWENWVSQLKASYRIISVDLPGHGLTRVPDDFDPDMRYLARFLDQFTDILELDRFTLIGSSMGGSVSWNFALSYPEKLEALILVGSSGWPASEAEKAERSLIFKLLANRALAFTLKNLDNSYFVAQALKDSLYDPNLITEEMLQRYLNLSRAPGHRDALISLSQREWVYATPETLAVITVPTLILHGEKDNLVPHRYGDLFQAAISGAQLIKYKNIGHLPHEEISQQSADDLKNFLERLSSEAVN